MNIIYLDGQDEINRDLLMRLVANNAARGSKRKLATIKKYHLDEINRICDYMMSILGGLAIDVRSLNACYYQALTELNIDSNDMTKVVKAKTDSNELEQNHDLAM